MKEVMEDHELFAALCRSTYFKQALETHPVITRLRSNVFNPGGGIAPLPICIDLDGIAQHYGLPTQYLDITSNFSVASFFATQRWDNKAKKFEPMRMNPIPGVIYQLLPDILIAKQGDGKIPYTPVGWQPFPRPEQQRANAIHLGAGEDFVKTLPVASFRFKHSRNQSKRIYEEFEGGDKLFPADDLADFAESVQSKTTFPQRTLEVAFKLYEKRRKPQDTAEKRESLMSRAGITLDRQKSCVTQQWDFCQKKFDAEIQRMLGRVRFRGACYAQ
ncbi:MAG: FRG domain-containing protein [Alteromonadaceae bacterium]|nr:FRG domain-containing protein [Alteromonadaceae bacterium]